MVLVGPTTHKTNENMNGACTGEGSAQSTGAAHQELGARAVAAGPV